MSFVKMWGKSFLGFLTGLVAVIVLGIVQSISNYSPVPCSTEVTEACTPGFLIAAYKAIIPTVSAVLVGFANWLKHKDD